jgi:hypothetical protein
MAAAVDHVGYLSLAAVSSHVRRVAALNDDDLLNAVRSICADRK